RYQHASTMLETLSPYLLRAMRTFDPELLRADVRTLLVRSSDRQPPPDGADPARRALTKFLSLSEGPASWQRADRALTLHMLEGHAPRFFANEGVAPILDAAVRALATVPTNFPIGIDPTEAMARLDALYIQHERAAGTARLDDAALSRYIRS